MRSLPSKLVAGGLSAGVVLLWWPHVLGRDDALSWVLRGICWTLFFELLVLCLRPLETALWAQVEQRRPARRLVALGSRLTPRSPSRHLAAASGLAAVAFSLPLALILEGKPATAERPRPAQVTEVTKVVRVVRPVQVKRVVVRELVPVRAVTRAAGPAPRATATATATATPTAPASASSAARARGATAPGRRAPKEVPSSVRHVPQEPTPPPGSAAEKRPTAKAEPEETADPAPAPAQAESRVRTPTPQTRPPVATSAPAPAPR